MSTITSDYESSTLLSQYLLLHYGQPETILPWSFGPREALCFPQRCVHEGLDLSRLDSSSRVLDIGCAVGGSTFELALTAPEVIGIDYSQSFINAAIQLKANGSLAYTYPTTGAQHAEALAVVNPSIYRQRVQFMQGDAHNLPSDLGGFDAVLCCNLICRLHTPLKFIERLATLVKPGGQLFITTPETWHEDYTPKEHWLSGKEGQPELLETLQRHLGASFTLEKDWYMPFLIREHARKYQWSVAQASRWIRRS